MSARWPDNVEVRADGLILSAAPSVTRLRFDDGGVRQAPAVTGITLTRDINVVLTPANLDSFRAWAAQFADEYFAWTDRFDGRTRQARVVAAAAGITYTQAGRDGRVQWQADMQIESAPEAFPAPTAEQPAVWPPTAPVTSAFTLQDDLRVDRTALDGLGAVRQRRRERTAPVIRQVRAQVLRGQLKPFLRWLLAYFHRPFAWPDPDGQTRTVRIRDGAGGVRLRQEGQRAGPARWAAELYLEDVRGKIRVPDRPGTVTLSDTTPTRGTAITATLSDADTPVANLTWQWQRGTTDIPDATSATYTPVLADVGKTLRAVASYNDAHGNAKTATSAPTSAVANTRDRFGTVTLSDTTPTRGTAITATLADTDTPVTALTWQWFRQETGTGGTEIFGATSDTYTPVRADVGRWLQAWAYYNDSHGDAKSAASGLTALVANTTDQAGAVTLSNTSPTRGQAITATLADADTPVTGLTWKWQRNRIDIAGATSATYTPVLADVGKRLKVIASYNDAHGNGKMSSANTYSVANTTDQAGVVTLSDTTPTRGQMLTATLADADTPVTALTWQWQRNTTNIAGATSATYTPARADVGQRLRAVASYHDAHGRGKTATSAPTGAVANTADRPGRITLSDTTPTRGTAITATLADPDGGITNLTWQWQRNGVDITGATSATYTPVRADVGQRLRTVASYNDHHGNAKTAASALSSAVANTTDQPGTVVLSTRPARVGRAITASLLDADTPVTALTWQWQRGTTDITGATAASYTPVTADVGQTLRAVASYNDDHADGKTATSAATGTVRSAADTTGTVALSETSPQVGSEVTATLTDLDTPITALTWQWQRATTDIAGATSATYTPVAGDVGQTLRAVASYNDDHGTAKTATSAATDAVAPAGDRTGTITFTPAAPKAGQRVKATLSDPDTPVTNLKWQWQYAIVRTSLGHYDLSAGRTDTLRIDEIGAVDVYYRAVASYDDGEGTDKTATSAWLGPF